MNYTFSEMLEKWLKTKDGIKKQSMLNYENMIKSHLEETLGKKKLNKLKKEDIENFFKELNKKEIAISTQKKIMYIIKSCLEYAYETKHTKKYLNLKSIKFKTYKKPIYVLSKKEQTVLENKLKTKPNIRKVCLLLCLYTGLRVGEISGLKWEDIDFKNNSLTVKRTIERIRNTNPSIKSRTTLIESTPKSDTSNRIIPFPAFLNEILLPFKGEDKNYILSKSQNKYDPRLFQSFYSRILKSCGIERCKFHTTRHTFSTRSIESKMDIKTLSELLGHSSIEITLKLYVHPSYELKKSSIENLVSFMSKL